MTALLIVVTGLVVIAAGVLIWALVVGLAVDTEDEARRQRVERDLSLRDQALEAIGRWEDER